MSDQFPHIAFDAVRIFVFPGLNFARDIDFIALFAFFEGFRRFPVANDAKPGRTLLSFSLGIIPVLGNRYVDVGHEVAIAELLGFGISPAIARDHDDLKRSSHACCPQSCRVGGKRFHRR
jgi:hypothetical protein